MNIAEIIKRIRELQIEQNELIKIKLKSIHYPTEPTAITDSREATPATNTGSIKPGDTVELLTGGVMCKVGDRAIVTKVNNKTIHFRTIRNGHHTHKKPTNLRKV